MRIAECRKGVLTGDHLMQRGPEGIDIRSMVDLRLGAGIGVCKCFGGAPSCDIAIKTLVALKGVKPTFRDIEMPAIIDEFRLTTRLNKNVFRANTAVYEPVFMAGCKHLAHALDHGESTRFWHRGMLGQDICDGIALDTICEDEDKGLA